MRKSISGRVFRYDPANDGEGHYEKYEVPYFDHMDVIDVLKYIQVNLDPTFALRYSCEEGKCGLCGLVVNGRPVLACKRVVQMGEELNIEPLPNFPVIRDLVVDRNIYNSEITDLQDTFTDCNAPQGPVAREREAEYVEYANCVECGACSALCPAGRAGVHTTAGPVGFLQAVRSGLFTPTPGITSEGGSDLFNCFECGQCLEICPRDVDVHKLVRVARGSTKNTDVWPEGAQRVTSMLRKSKVLLAHSSQQPGNTAAWLRQAGMRIANQVGKVESNVGFFVGCQYGMRRSLQSTAIHFAQLLLHAGIDFTVLGESEWCCGHPSYAAGDVEAATEFARHNVREFAKFGVRTVVCACPGCYRAWKYEYPDMLEEETGLRVLHSSEVLLSLLKRGDLKPHNKQESLVYHDPCELGRLSKIYEPPREVMRSIPGIELVEMRENRELAQCCGGGGLVPAANPELSGSVAERRAKELVDSGASMAVTACPSCEVTLGSTLQKLGETQVAVWDIIDVLHNAVFNGDSP